VAFTGLAQVTRDVAVLDAVALTRLERIGGPMLARQMAELFLEHGPERIAHAQAAFDAASYQEVADVAHTLKSSAGNVGAQRLVEVTSALDDLIRGNDTVQSAAVRSLIAALRDEYDVAAAALRDALPEIA
jgi:HPt (histidine-containing phosphotransfer) domain-containing protein